MGLSDGVHFTILLSFLRMRSCIYHLLALSIITYALGCVQCESKKSPSGLVAIFRKRLGIFQLNFTCLLRVPTYARIQIFIQLSAILTKLCHIKCDHPACVLVDGGHFEHTMVVALIMA